MNIEQVKILVIDDNPIIYEDFKKILTIDRSTLNANKELDQMASQLFADDELEGIKNSEQPLNTLDLPTFVIDYASQGEAGVEKIKEAYEKNEPYILAFVDIRMPPGMDGVQTVKKIWEIDKDIQIVICTAFSDYSWEAMLEELGTKDNLLIIHKPFDNVTVRQMACALNKKWSLFKSNQQHQQLLETKVKKRTESLKKSLSISRATLDASAEGIIVISKDNLIKDYNNNFSLLFDLPPNMIASFDKKSLFEYISQKVEGDSKDVLRNLFYSSPSSKSSNDHNELALLNGRILDCTVSPYKIENKVCGMVLNVRDLTKRISLERKLKYHASHDYLTGLHNRKSLIANVSRFVAKNNKYNKANQFCVLFLDLDSFKKINDSMGHETGDAILKSMARIINTICDKDTIAGRLGGDEFVIIKKEGPTHEEINKFCENLISLVNEEIIINGSRFNLKVSIGIAEYPEDAETGQALLKKADLAMYESKKRGGNQYNYYKAEYDGLSKELYEKEQSLERAFKNNELVLYYQPQINIINGEIIAVEALIRWNNRDLGLLNAAEFIHFAEYSKFIVDIGKWTLVESCKQNKAWQDMGLQKFKIAVNVAQLQLLQDDFIDTVKHALNVSGLEPQYLNIELNENIFMDNEKLIVIANNLKAIGVSIAFDDFGTGRIGLNNLVKVPVQQIKIDKHFVKNMFDSKTDEVIVKAILHMAKELNVEVVAEGIETPEQMQLLSDYGCENMQGYYFSKAMPPSDVVNFLDGYSTKQNLLVSTFGEENKVKKSG